MFTLVPSNFYDPAKELEALSDVGTVPEGSKTEHVEIPQYDAVLIYNTDEDSIFSEPVIAELLRLLPTCPDYNKILCRHRNGKINIAIAQGKQLMLANEFDAPDFTTAQYYIFLCVKSLQINPELSTISWLGSLDEDDKMSLYRYFKSVSVL